MHHAAPARQLMPGFRNSLVAAIAGALLFAGTSTAQQNSPDVRTLVDRLNRLEADLNGVQRQMARGGAPAATSGGPAAARPGGADIGGDAANRLSERLDQLEQALREITGRFEEVEYKNGQMLKRFDKVVEDVDFRLAEIERRGQAGGQPAAQAQAAPQATGQTTTGQAAPAQAAATTGAPPTTANRGAGDPSSAPSAGGTFGQLRVNQGGQPLPPAGGGSATAAAPAPAAAAPRAAAKLPEGTPQERYNFALGLLRQDDYAGAEQAFTQFIAAHDKDPLAGNAQYWLGETHYVRQEYQKAAAAFLQGYQKYQKGAKAPDSLLKLGMTLTNLNQKQEACATFAQLTKEFPGAAPPLKQTLASERQRAGCR